MSAYLRQAADLPPGVVLFGAGNLGRYTLKGLREVRIPVLSFADNNQSLWGTEVDGIPVLPPSEAAKRHGDSAAFIMTIWGGASNTYAQRRAILQELGCRTVIHCGLLFWSLPQVFLPYYAMDLPDRLLVQRDSVRQTYSLLEDGRSREEFVAQVRWRLLLDFDRLPDRVKDPVYFPPDLYELNDAEVFVDCGAYEGDTIESLLSLTSFGRGTVFAFEPDPLTFARLEQYHAKLKQGARSRIHISRKAVGQRAGSISFAMTGTPASAVGSGDTVVECVPLDDALKGVHPTIIKMDIEGSEIDALNGAADIIRAHRPILAISAYHTQNHFWEIPQLIKQLCSDYHIFLRPHLLEVWELVCYAVPSHRLRSV
jgi:FkbM family methyltransferase